MSSRCQPVTMLNCAWCCPVTFSSKFHLHFHVTFFFFTFHLLILIHLLRWRFSICRFLGSSFLRRFCSSGRAFRSCWRTFTPCWWNLFLSWFLSHWSIISWGRINLYSFARASGSQSRRFVRSTFSFYFFCFFFVFILIICANNFALLCVSY